MSILCLVCELTTYLIAEFERKKGTSIKVVVSTYANAVRSVENFSDFM